MKRIMTLSVALIIIGLTAACTNEHEDINQTAEELIIGSWKVIDNYIEVQGDSIYEWDDKLVGRYHKFSSDSVGRGILYVEGERHCTYVIIGNKIYFSKGLLWEYRYDGNPGESDDSSVYTIEFINSSKLKIVSDRWSVSGMESGNYVSIIEFERL